MKIACGLAALVLLAGGSVFAAPADQRSDPIGNCRYFIATGHYVCEEFLQAYEDLGGDTILGQPLSEAFLDSARGGLVQYFERARMELHDSGAGSQTVQLGALVGELGYSFPRLGAEDIPRFRTALRRYYAGTGHTVSLAFLEFYLENGGADTFGLPVSEARFEAGLTVQYFERARMEWHPEAEPRPEVRVSKLVAVNLDRFGVPPSVGVPLPPPPSALSAEGEPVRTTARELRVSASVGSIVTGPTGHQAVHVFVIDQQGGPVKDVFVAVAVRYPSGTATFDLQPTDEKGYTGRVFELEKASAGERVIIDVNAIHGDLVGETQTFFLPWW